MPPPASRFMLAALLTLGIGPGPAAAQPIAPVMAQVPSNDAIRAGAWQVVSGEPGQAMAGYTVCLKNGADDLQLLLPKVTAGGPACSAASTRREGSELVWELSCAPGASRGVIAAGARYKLAPEHIEGEISISSAQPPQMRRQTLSARYVGPCP